MTCEKIPYNTYFEAQTVINQANSQGRRILRHLNRKKPKRAYKCPYCGKYHLTSQKILIHNSQQKPNTNRPPSQQQQQTDRCTTA